MAAWSRLSAVIPALAFAALPALLAPPFALAQADDTPELVRSDFADRRWTPVTAADAGLSGAGLATDPASSAYANPALWLTAGWSFRISGGMMNPDRNDLRGSTTDFQEANGFPLLSEAAIRFKSKGLGFGAYFAQPHYEHGETRFVGFDPETGEGDPFARTNTFTSATRLAGAGAAMRLGGGVVVGAGVEGVFTVEKYLSVPDVPAGSGIADTSEVDVNDSSVGGVLGVLVPIGSTWNVAGSYRFAGDLAYGENGTGYDDAPTLGLLGVRYGRTAGSAGYAGLRWLAERAVNLGVPAAPSDVTADSRMEYALGYAYLDPASGWAVRIGGALSPAPNEESNRLTRFGVSLGLGGDGLRGSLAYSRESETRPDDRNSSRNLVLATVELGN